MVEREATHRAIALAELAGIPIMVVHVSGREAVEQIEWARRRGLPLNAWTVNAAADVKRLAHLDVNGLMADNPKLLKDAFKEA